MTCDWYRVKGSSSESVTGTCWNGSGNQCVSGIGWKGSSSESVFLVKGEGQ